MNRTLTAVPGVRVGHAEVEGGGSGCTVVLGPFRGAADVRGIATGTREMNTLTGHHLVSEIDAILLSGGSAFGLASAEGVMGWLEERGAGFDTGAARVPIVPGAVVFDLAEGVSRPGPAEGRSACENAAVEPVAEGRVGAGAGALVGKITGPGGACPGGVGSSAGEHGAFTVGVLAVVNALGDVLDRGGAIVAGARDPDGMFLDTSRLLRARGSLGEFGRLAEPPPGTNTTLAVVATDAPLSGPDLERVARLASTGLARRISPVNTPFDGDVVFVLSTSDPEPLSTGRVMALGVIARDLVEEAVERAVQAGAREADTRTDMGDDRGRSR